MTDILDEARKMLEGVPEGPWKVTTCALIERVAALEAENKRLRGAVKQGAAWFREYETEHRKKAERGPNVAEAEARFDKADRNADRAEYLERAILAKGGSDAE